MVAEIFFPPVDPVWEFDRDCVRFYAVVEGRALVCLVSAEALFQHFGARRMEAEECIRAFREARPQIEDVARRKIERADARGLTEVLVTTRDFRAATEHEPNVSGRIRIKIAGDISHDPRLEELVRRTTTLLATEVVHSPSRVTATWTGMTSSGGPLLYLRLVDEDTRASSENLFTPHDLEDESVARFALFRLYDDLLRAKGGVLMERFQEREAAEGKS